ncbi:MAG TPA: S53 family peptidase [Solirubrobacteraceae bacterium]|nr:S53 family peptidase [Solirubrobacteraceae bacterium]
MHRAVRSVGLSLGLAVGLLAVPASALALPHSNAHGLSSRHVCAAPTAGQASCDALRVTTSTGKTFKAKPTPNATIAGYHPADLQSAYNLATASAGSGAGQTVAIVDAYNDPYAASDVATYRSQFGLPALGTCSLSTGKVSSQTACFAQVSQTGSTTSLPRSNASWSQEISLDLDMVSAVCPKCNILLVEASSASMTNLGTAVNEAVKLGATEVSNSYGGSESSSDTKYDSSYFNHAGVDITASSGDSGYGVEYPAASIYVTSVGGTTLNQASNARGWSETAWSSAGSGCSAYDPQPSWQAGAFSTSLCGNRAVADVSADADPNTGVSVYDSYAYQGYKGWMVFGGTSVASPITASVYALAGGGAPVGNPYSHTSSLNDVTSGSNGSCGNALCTAGPGWDGPTGLGTPNGTGAF